MRRRWKETSSSAENGPCFRRRHQSWPHTLSPRHAMSSTTESSPPDVPQQSHKKESDDDELAEKLEKLEVESTENSVEETSTSAGDIGSSDENNPPRPLIVYTRKELIHLSTSPLVKVPDRMPAFKAWFGCVRFEGSRFSFADLVTASSSQYHLKARRNRNRPTEMVQTGTEGIST